MALFQEVEEVLAVVGVGGVASYFSQPSPDPYYNYNYMIALAAAAASVPIGLMARKIRHIVFSKDQRLQYLLRALKSYEDDAASQKKIELALRGEIDEYMEYQKEQEKFEKDILGRMVNLQLKITHYETELVYLNAKTKDVDERVAHVMTFVGSSEIMCDHLQDMASLSLSLLDDYSQQLEIAHQMKAICDKENTYLQEQVIDMTSKIQEKNNECVTPEEKITGIDDSIKGRDLDSSLLQAMDDEFKMKLTAQSKVEVGFETKEDHVQVRGQEYAQLQEKIAGLESEMQLKDEKYETIHVELETMKDQVQLKDQEYAQLQEKFTGLECEMEVKDQKYNTIQVKLETMEDQGRVKDQEYAKLQERFTGLECEMDLKDQKYNIIQVKLETMEDQGRAKDQEYAKLQGKIIGLECEMELKDQKCDTILVELETMRDNVQVKDQEYVQLQGKFASMEKSIKEKDLEYAQLQEKITGMSDLFKGKDLESSLLQEEVSAMDGQLQMKLSALSKMEVELQTMEDQVQVKDQEYAQLKEKITGLEYEMELKDQKYDTIHVELETMKDHVQIKDQEYAQLQEKITRLECEMELKDQKYNTILVELETTKDHVRVKNHEYDQLQEKITRLECDMELKDPKYDRIIEKVVTMEKSIKEKDQECAQLQDAVVTLEKAHKAAMAKQKTCHDVEIRNLNEKIQIQEEEHFKLMEEFVEQEDSNKDLCQLQAQHCEERERKYRQCEKLNSCLIKEAKIMESKIKALKAEKIQHERQDTITLSRREEESASKDLQMEDLKQQMETLEKCLVEFEDESSLRELEITELKKEMLYFEEGQKRWEKHCAAKDEEAEALQKKIDELETKLQETRQCLQCERDIAKDCYKNMQEKYEEASEHSHRYKQVAEILRCELLARKAKLDGDPSDLEILERVTMVQDQVPLYKDHIDELAGIPDEIALLGKGSSERPRLSLEELLALKKRVLAAEKEKREERRQSKVTQTNDPQPGCSKDDDKKEKEKNHEGCQQTLDLQNEIIC